MVSDPPLAVAWYRKDQWNRLRELASDRNDLAPTFAEWRSTADLMCWNMETRGHPLQRIDVDVEMLWAWCCAYGRPLDGPARAEYVAQLSRQMHGGRAGEPDQIRFDDGAAYERYMGKWSQLAGKTFLDWLAADAGWRWLDVGCGNGAFTEMLVERCAPASVHGIDPSEGQLAYARTRPGAQVAQFRQGDAMALPFGDDTFDVAVMPLVIFFVPDPTKGVAEMARVVRPGGTVAAYAWDMPGGGFPYEALHVEMRAMGVAVPVPPSPDASRMDALRDLWSGAGLAAIETREITVERTFAGFEDYWTTIRGGPSVGAKFAAMAAADRARLETRMRVRLPADAMGRITYRARANAVKGRVPD